MITRTEERPYIDRWRAENPEAVMPRFEYVPVPRILDAKPFRGQFQSLRLNPWLRRVRRRVEGMLRFEEFDVIHQITPVEFRAVMKPIPHDGINVVGPLGGGGEPCEELKPYLGSGKAEKVRLAVNAHVARSRDYAGELSAYDIRYFANRETRDFLLNSGAGGGDSIVTDVGCDGVKPTPEVEGTAHQPLRLLFVGRLVPRKGARVLLEALVGLDPSSYELRIYGDGPERDSLEAFAKERGLSKVIFMGRLDHSEIDGAYGWADVFVFPSVRDTTGVVLVEALSHGVPVIAFDQFGARVVLNEECALLVPPDQGAAGFAAALEIWASHTTGMPTRDAALTRAEEMTWQAKASAFAVDYKRCLNIAKLSRPQSAGRR